MSDGSRSEPAGPLSTDDSPERLSVRCGKPVEVCTACGWHGGNRPDKPCTQCGGEVIQRPCKRWATAGTDACSSHGSGTKAAKAAGRRRIASGKAAKTLRDVEVTPLGDPLDELADLAAEARALQQWFADRVAELSEQRKDAEAAEALKLYTSALHEVGKLLERCARLGIEGRRTDALVAQGQLIAQVIRGSIEAAFAALLACAVDGRLEVDAVIRVQHEVVPGLVRAQITEATGEMKTD